MDELIRLKKQFNDAPTICNLLQVIAYDTWKRIEFARTRIGLKIYETTITQNILYELRMYSELYPQLHLQMYEAINEPANGNDIELIIKIKQGYVLIPLQAKLLYNSDLYQAMEHGNQIFDLIDYGNRVGGIPLYLLYNYYSHPNFNHTGNRCGIKYAQEQFGCSLVSADYLLHNFAFNRTTRTGTFKWTIPYFTDLHPEIALPWFVLGCCVDSETSIVDLVGLFMDAKKLNSEKDNFPVFQRLRIYELNELINDDEWQPFQITGKAIGEGILYEPADEMQKSGPYAFSPKYRIVLASNDEAVNNKS